MQGVLIMYCFICKVSLLVLVSALYAKCPYYVLLCANCPYHVCFIYKVGETDREVTAADVAPVRDLAVVCAHVAGVADECGHEVLRVGQVELVVSIQV